MEEEALKCLNSEHYTVQDSDLEDEFQQVESLLPLILERKR